MSSWRYWRFIQAWFLVRRVHRLIEQEGFRGARQRYLPQWKTRSRDIRPDSRVAQEISWAVIWACTWQPDKSECLYRAIAAYYLLRNAGAQPVFIMAARVRPFAAHAWVELDGVVIADSLPEDQRDRYTPTLKLPQALSA